jgi:hypothetical protein
VKQRKLRPVPRKLSVSWRSDMSLITALIIQSCTNLALLFVFHFGCKHEGLSDLTYSLELDRTGHMTATRLLTEPPYEIII